VPITVTVENLSPRSGFFVTPVWVAFHNGSFDTFDQNRPLTPGGAFEPLVEDGVTGPISALFRASPAALAGGIDDTIRGNTAGVTTPAVFDPGERNSLTLDVNPAAGRFFTFAAMVIPSNDAFIGNDDPLAVPVFGATGNFLGPITFTVLGAEVRDAGTELNDEQNAAFFNQPANGLGTTTNDPVLPHPGLLGSAGHPAGTRVILGGTSTAPVPGVFFDANNADFTRPGAAVLRVTITPEPSGALLPLGAMAAGCVRRRRRMGL
jgi:MYXO-CTERM domain-containing protein